MMKNNFAIFIISHERANNQFTYEALKKSGYTGNIYIIVDDSDEQLELYKKKYPKEIIIFNKDEMLKKGIDTVDNFNNKKTALIPSNYCFELAKEKGLKFFLKIDDDIKSFNYRYEENSKLKSKPINNMDGVISLFIEYLENTKIDCLAFGNAGGYIGGLNGKFSEKVSRNIAGSFLFKTDTDIRFIGTRQEDFNTIAKYTPRGKLFFEILDVCICTSKRNENSGGCSTDYKNAGMYTVNFYSIIVGPSFTKMICKEDFTVKRNYNALEPKILNERWKK